MKISKTIRLFTSQLARSISFVFTGNLFSAILGFFTVLIISRAITVSNFGLFNIVISMILILQPLANLGMNTVMIKFASFYLATGKTVEASHVIRVVLFIKVLISFILAAIIFNMAGLLSSKVFHYSHLAPLLRLASFGILSFSIFYYSKSVLLAYKKFTECVVLQLLVDFARLLIVGILILSLKLDAFSAVTVFTFIPLLGALLGFWRVRRELFSKGKQIKNLLSNLLSYSKWIFVSAICKGAFLYVGILILARMLNSEAAGIYGLALNLTRIFPILIVSLNSVLLPEVSRFREIEQFERYVRISLKISLIIGIVIIPILFLSNKIIPFFFGPRYLDSIPIFNWLLLGFIFYAIISILTQPLYSINKPHIIAFLDLFRVTAMVLGCYFLIPFIGVSAPAIIALVINACALGFLTIYVFQQIQGREIVIQKDEEAIEPVKVRA